MRDIRSFTSTVFFAFILSFSLLFVAPLTAYAISENPQESTLESVNNGETMDANNGIINVNNGTIDTNNGTIINNYSTVFTNNGTIVNNYSYNTNPGKGSGIIQNNYLVRAAMTTDDGWVLPELWGTENNYYRIQNQSALDWSLNPSNFSSPLWFYIGASNNVDGQRGATFKAAEGYRITLKETNNTNFKVTDNGDGTFTIAVTNLNYRETEINLDDAINIEKVFSVSVKATPVEGGSIIHSNSGEPFVSGDYNYNTRLSLEAKASEGYRFVGWVGVPEQEGVFTEGNKLIISPRMDYEWESIQAISCIAEFEKIPDSNDGAEAPGSASTGGSNDKSSTSQSVLPPTGDATFVIVALLSVVVIVASILGFIAFRKRA